MAAAFDMWRKLNRQIGQGRSGVILRIAKRRDAPRVAARAAWRTPQRPFTASYVTLAKQTHLLPDWRTSEKNWVAQLKRRASSLLQMRTPEFFEALCMQILFRQRHYFRQHAAEECQGQMLRKDLQHAVNPTYPHKSLTFINISVLIKKPPPGRLCSGGGFAGNIAAGRRQAEMSLSRCIFWSSSFAPSRAYSLPR